MRKNDGAEKKSFRWCHSFIHYYLSENVVICIFVMMLNQILFEHLAHEHGKFCLKVTPWMSLIKSNQLLIIIIILVLNIMKLNLMMCHVQFSILNSLEFFDFLIYGDRWHTRDMKWLLFVCKWNSNWIEIRRLVLTGSSANKILSFL